MEERQRVLFDALKKDKRLLIQSQISQQKTQYQSLLRSLASQRRTAVKDAVSIFRLRRVQRKSRPQVTINADGSSSDVHKPSPYASNEELVPNRLGETQNPLRQPSVLTETPPIEYRLVHVGYNASANVNSSAQREKLNAVIGYALQMTILLSSCLQVSLPFPLVFLGADSYARSMAPENSKYQSSFPLPLHEF